MAGANICTFIFNTCSLWLEPQTNTFFFFTETTDFIYTKSKKYPGTKFSPKTAAACFVLELLNKMCWSMQREISILEIYTCSVEKLPIQSYLFVVGPLELWWAGTRYPDIATKFKLCSGCTKFSSTLSTR